MQSGRFRMLALLTTTLTLLLAPVVEALFEDELGQYEWIQQNIGKPTCFAYSADATDRVFVASASGVVASVMLKDGNVQWRRVAAAQSGIRLLRAGSRGILSVTQGSFVQAWKPATGDLTWQREYPDTIIDLLLAGSNNKQKAIVIRENEVEARTMAGKQEWSTPMPSGMAGARFQLAALSQDETSVAAVALLADGSAKNLQIDVATGKVLSQKELPKAVSKGLSAGSFLVADLHLVLLVKDELSVHPLFGGEAGTFQLKNVKSADRASFRLMQWQRTRGVFAATNGLTTAVFGLNPKGLKHLRTFEDVAVVGPVFSVHDDEGAQPVAVAILKDKGTQIQLMDPASGNVQPAISAPDYTAVDHGSAELLLVHELSTGDHRIVISAVDHSVAGIQGTNVTWVREEGLASIRQAVFYSRSAAVISAKRASQPNAPQDLQALGAQLAELPERIQQMMQDPGEAAAAFLKWLVPKRARRGPSKNIIKHAKEPTCADELRDFGADKLILAVSRAWKVFALEATTSEMVWSRYLGHPGPDCMNHPESDGTDIGGCSPWMQLLPSSAASYSELLIVTPSALEPGSPKKPHRLMWLEPLSGGVLHEELAPAGAKVGSIVPLPRRGNPQLTVLPFLIVDSEKKVHTLPSQKVSSELSKFVEETADRLFHYEVDTSEQVVQGFMMGHEGKASELVPLWNLELGSVGEQILTSAAPEHREWNHVPVYIKGDASILYKYINANLLAVVTEDTRVNSSALNLYAIDAVTGHIVHQSHIAGGAKPVHLVVCDNWVIMHYRNPKKTRFEIVVMEFFQAKSDEGPWDILFTGKATNQTLSAHHLETPVPLQQTYIFPAGVTAMGVTATLKGITPRSIIMALTTDQLFHVSKDLLNPRRPYQASGGGGEKDKSAIPAQFAPTKEEALPMYQPLLPYRQTDVLTYFNSMGQVAGIISSPTALESTSLVFSFGLDLFLMPVQTAKAYDVLSPGFNYLFVYASVGLVVVVFIVTSFWAQQRALQDRWK